MYIRILVFCSTLVFGYDALGIKSRSCREVLKLVLSTDQKNWSRSWGTKLLLDSDSTWRDPEYIERAGELVIPQLSIYEGLPQYLYHRVFEQLGELGNGRVLAITTSGTQANNLFYEIAEYLFHYRRRVRKSAIKLLYFGSPYGGSFGKVANISRMNPKAETRFQIEAPLISPWELGVEKVDVKTINAENRALEAIRRKVTDPKSKFDIGGIFIEPVAIHSDIGVYRPEFLRRLRSLADSLHLPIFADEVLSGGGHSGHFWSFQYAEGFSPDYLSFGKGLIVAGVFKPNRSGNFTRSSKESVYAEGAIDIAPRETMSAHPMALLQAYQLLNTIQERDLVENARRTGSYIREVLEKRLALSKNKMNLKLPSPKNLGLILSADWLTLSVFGAIEPDSYGRLLPPLTLTREEVDAAISEGSRKSQAF